MDSEKQQITDRLKKANNVLVTVSQNPSIDQLSACIGLSLALNKLDKHASAVFSGTIPSAIKFLQPEDTIEKTTDSLRDFIISLDKSKADKLRYKVEDKIVRIFITPYRTSISDKDLDFSQGDFNVDVVLALGVHEQSDLDKAITSHGRILHDATVVTMNNGQGGNLGGINWLETSASSLAEMATTLIALLGKDLLDEQIATALLTGIVSETDRFSNEKTSADTMKTSAALMAAGANQQLVANKLQPPAETSSGAQASLVEEVPADSSEDIEKKQDADTLRIDHEAPEDQEDSEDHKDDKDQGPEQDESPKQKDEPPQETEVKSEEKPEPTPEPAPEIVDPEEAAAEALLPPAEPKEEPRIKLNSQKPLGGSDNYEHPRTAVSNAGGPNAPAFSSAMNPQADEKPSGAPMNLPPVQVMPESEAPKETLQDLERQVHSTHLNVEPPKPAEEQPKAEKTPEELNLEDLQRPAGIDTPPSPLDADAARDAVAQAVAESTTRPEARFDVTAQPLGGDLHPQPPADTPEAAPVPPAPASTAPLVPPVTPPTPPNTDSAPTAEQAMTMPLPPMPPPINPAEAKASPDAPPPLPPPMVPPSRP